MKKWIFILFSALFCSSAAMADIVSVEAYGTGETYNKAVDAALADAVRQVNGVSVATQSERPGNYIKVEEKGSVDINVKSDEKRKAEADKAKEDEGYDDSDYDLDNSVSKILDMGVDGSVKGQREATIQGGSSEKLDVHAFGQVKGYSVLERDCNEKSCAVRLSVQINKVVRKENQAVSKRDRLAIITTGNSRNSNFAKQLQQKLTDKLSKSHRYTLLARTNETERAFKQEEDFLEGRMDNATDLKQSTIAADYILSINVTQAGVSSSTEYNYIDMTGELNIKRSSNTRVKISYALLEASTRIIHWSDSIEFNQYGRVLQKSQDELTQTIVDRIVNTTSPAKIVGINNGKVIINRGEGFVQIGDVFDIYNVGETLVDPDTGEVLGVTEEKVASIVIDTVNPKLSYGYLEIGRIDMINKGDIVRPGTEKVEKTEKKVEEKKDAAKEKPKAKTTTTTKKGSSNKQQLGSTGGIILK